MKWRNLKSSYKNENIIRHDLQSLCIYCKTFNCIPTFNSCMTYYNYLTIDLKMNNKVNGFINNHRNNNASKQYRKQN